MGTRAETQKNCFDDKTFMELVDEYVETGTFPALADEGMERRILDYVLQAGRKYLHGLKYGEDELP